jgi:twitching motility protein PilT
VAKIDELLLRMMENSASDLHVVVGQKPKYRIHGDIIPVEEHPAFEAEQLRNVLGEIITPRQHEDFIKRRDFDFAYGVGDQARYRCNYFFQRTGYGAVFRIIPTKISTIDDLKLPAVLKKLAELRGGLVLVTGPTGSGKSTSLAAIIDYINRHQRRHIVTIEDPIEFVHKNRKSIITHREVGAHTESFGAALRGVFRQDADVVLVGEMRDLETISLALSAAATGTLVYATLHTNSAAKTIDRIIDVFPAEQQDQIRTMLAESLKAVVAQQLLRLRDGHGRIACHEILLCSGAVGNIIREAKVESIINVIQSGRTQGMQTMDDGLERLLKQNLVEPEDAYMKANDKRKFEEYMPKSAE